MKTLLLSHEYLPMDLFCVKNTPTLTPTPRDYFGWVPRGHPRGLSDRWTWQNITETYVEKMAEGLAISPEKTHFGLLVQVRDRALSSFCLQLSPQSSTCTLHFQIQLSQSIKPDVLSECSQIYLYFNILQDCHQLLHDSIRTGACFVCLSNPEDMGPQYLRFHSSFHFKYCGFDHQRPSISPKQSLLIALPVEPGTKVIISLGNTLPPKLKFRRPFIRRLPRLVLRDINVFAVIQLVIFLLLGIASTLQLAYQRASPWKFLIIVPFCFLGSLHALTSLAHVFVNSAWRRSYLDQRLPYKFAMAEIINRFYEDRIEKLGYHIRNFRPLAFLRSRYQGYSPIAFEELQVKSSWEVAKDYFGFVDLLGGIEQAKQTERIASGFIGRDNAEVLGSIIIVLSNAKND
jgi:hypothetical protein